MKAFLLLLLAVSAVAGRAQVAEGSRPGRWTIAEHRFELGAVAGSLAADALTTRSMLDRGNYERNTLARPFVQSTGGTVAYFSMSYAAVLESNHLLRSHPRLKHILNWSVVALEGFCAFHNTQLPDHRLKRF